MVALQNGYLVAMYVIRADYEEEVRLRRMRARWAGLGNRFGVGLAWQRRHESFTKNRFLGAKHFWSPSD